MKIEPATTSGPNNSGEQKDKLGGIVGGSEIAVISVILVVIIAQFVDRRRSVTVLSYFIQMMCCLNVNHAHYIIILSVY